MPRSSPFAAKATVSLKGSELRCSLTSKTKTNRQEEGMTAKAEMQKIVESPVSVNGNAPTTAQPEYKLIAWSDLQPSPTNPRRRIDEKTIEALAASLGSQGILEPLIARKVGENYEIVCGERRYRAAKVAGLPELPCLVRDLSDEQVLDIQIHENLHREDVHPMDEAYGYQFLKEKLGCETKELALRVGKAEGYVLNRLKLNQLIDEAQKDVEENHLPLTYALEIAKYTPEIQKMIYTEVYRKEGKYQGDRYVSVSIKGETVPWKSFIEWINTNVHRLLCNAPFDAKATNLRDDGLACINCPERTGAVVSLFEPNQIGKKDACLNPGCYMEKARNHVDVRRRELAELRKVDPSEVPIVRSWCYTDGDGYFGTESAVVISGAKRGDNAKDCKKAISGIDIEAENYGKTVQVCLKTTGCKTHWPEFRTNTNGNSAPAKNAEQESAERLESHRSRREEIWNAKVAEAVRVRVFKLAAEKFEKKFRITDVGTDSLPQLVSRFWRMTSSGDSNNLNGVVKKLVSEWESEAEQKQSIDLSNSWNLIDVFKKLERGFQFRILFLLIHCDKGTIYHGNNYASQKEVEELAAEFSINYALIDAEVRLEFCAKKHHEVHQAYLEAVKEKSKEAKVPRLFLEKWKPGD
jgi:ParB/RepB/Spo0J family partition protein